MARWKMIDTALGLGLPEPEETYSSSEHLYEVMKIPAGSTGRMVKSKPVKKEVPAKAEQTTEKRARTRTKKFKND